MEKITTITTSSEDPEGGRLPTAPDLSLELKVKGLIASQIVWLTGLLLVFASQKNSP